MMKYKMEANIVVLFCLLINVLYASKIPVVVRPDCGTCGNACCTMEYILFGNSPTDAFHIISHVLKSGGPDGNYRYIEGKDIRFQNQSAQYIIQGGHNSNDYLDMMNFVFYDNPKVMATTVIGFSISTQPINYCDNGQNYDNLINLINTLDVTFTEVHVAGCPPAPDPIYQKKISKKPSLPMMSLYEAKLLP